MSNTFAKTVRRRSKRVGRGYGSGKGGHTVGRGAKGQKARSSVNILFEGFKAKKSLLRRLPLQRGKGKLKPNPKPFAVNIEKLNILADGTVVNIESLIKAGLVDARVARANGVKILGKGKLEKKLKIALPISAAAATLVQEAGGELTSK